MQYSMANSLISVIVPAYNAVGWLARCVDSVLGQTYANVEIVIVDDGSSDGTARIADACAAADPRVRAVHQSNKGLSGARNTGIEHARGDKLYFLDSDDFIDSDHLETLARAMAETGAPMVVGGITEVDEAGTLLSSVLVEPCVVDEKGYWDSFEAGCLRGQYNEYIISCGKLFDKSIFDIERFDEGKIHEDEIIVHRLVSRAGRVAFANTAGYNYVRTAGSISHSPSLSALLDSAEGILARCSHFEKQGWWDNVFEALIQVRGPLSLAVECDAAALSDDRFRNIKKQWFSAFRRAARRIPGKSKSKVGCLLFALSPRLFVATRRMKR